MSKPMNEVTRTIRSEQALEAFIQVVRRNLPLNLKNTLITADDRYQGSFRRRRRYDQKSAT